MQYLTVCRVVVALWCFCCGVFAQSKLPATAPPQAQSLPATPAKKLPPKPKLTPQQEQGLRLLKTAEAEAAGLEAPTRTYVLWRVSHGYRKIDPANADAVLRRAFLASRGIEDQAPSEDCQMELVCHVKNWLQWEIIEEMLQSGKGKASPERVEKLLPQVDPDLRKRMLGVLAGEYLREHNLDRVRELMEQMDDDQYPYALAGELIAAIPASRRDERLAVFSQAFQNYRNRSLENLDPDNFEDFGILVIRFWRELPSSLVLDAADTILERSRDRDESKKMSSVTMTLLGGKSMAFASEYEFRLFELLPILKELDPAKAEHLLAQHDTARKALDQYPSGMQSLDSNYYGDKPLDEKRMPGVLQVMPALDDPAVNSQLQHDVQIDAQIQGIREEAKKNPEQAYQDAMNLPLQKALRPGSPRASGLKWVALNIVKQNPTLARTAMSEARRLAQDVEPSMQAMILEQVPDFYLKLGDEDGARSAIKDQMKLAEKIYAIDTDADDPNLAFKGAWPSSETWRNCIKEATRISPAFADELLAQISDPDIAGLQRVMYANALLSAGESSIAVVEWHKGGKRSGMFMSR